MTLAPKSLPLQDDRFILEMFILLQVAASPAVPFEERRIPFPPTVFHIPPCKYLGRCRSGFFSYLKRKQSKKIAFTCTLSCTSVFLNLLYISFYNPLLFSVLPLLTPNLQVFLSWSPIVLPQLFPSVLSWWLPLSPPSLKFLVKTAVIF